MILKVDGITFSFINKPVLKNVSFSVDKGDMLAILGPNGVGKTTLMNLLTGILYPSTGSISINDVENPYNGSVAKFFNQDLLV